MIDVLENTERRKQITKSQAMKVNTVFDRIIIVRIEDAASLPNKDLTGKSDPYVEVSFAYHKAGAAYPPKVSTKVVDNSLEPHWGQQFAFLVSAEIHSFVIEVKDSDVGFDSQIASFEVKIDSDYRVDQVALNPEGSMRFGYRVVSLQSLETNEKLWKGVTSDSQEENMFGGFNRLCILGLRGAFNLKDGDFFGRSDAYAVVKWDNPKIVSLPTSSYGKTTVLKDCLSPVWLESFVYLCGPAVDHCIVEVFDDDVGFDDVLGRCDVLLKDGRVSAEEVGVVKQGSLLYDTLVIPLSAFSIDAADLPAKKGNKWKTKSFMYLVLSRYDSIVLR